MLEDGKYKNIFKQILNKINHFFNNKNNIEIINLFTEIKEKQNISMALKKEHQKLMNNKPYKGKSLINERKNMELKDNLKKYNDLNNKILKIEKNLNYLNKKLNIYKNKEENDKNNKNYIDEYDEYKLKQSLIMYNNTIKKLREEINIKENELNSLKEKIN